MEDAEHCEKLGEQHDDRHHGSACAEGMRGLHKVLFACITGGFARHQHLIYSCYETFSDSVGRTERFYYPEQKQNAF